LLRVKSCSLFPILVKDNIATADRTETTSRSYALVGTRVPKESTVVRKLREVGAIVLGKAQNLSQTQTLKKPRNLKSFENPFIRLSYRHTLMT